MTATTMIKTLRRRHLEVEPTLVAKILRGPRSLIAVFRRWHSENVAIGQMASMSDAQLRDLGIHRSEIDFMVREFKHNGSRRHAYYSD